NLFDVAWAMVLRNSLPIDQRARIELEMLEGMAPAQSRAVRKLSDSLLLYAPVVQEDQIDASIAYLARRLDENTAPENFLRALFTISPGSPEFAEQADSFRRSVAERHKLATGRRRRPAPINEHGFTNEPDSDPTDPVTRQRIRDAVEAWSDQHALQIVGSVEEIDQIVATAVAAARTWSLTTAHERREILASVADVFRRERFATIGVMAAEAVKV